MSAEYEQLIGRLRSNLQRLTAGASRLGLAVLGGETKGREDIKRRIKNWRPDTFRV